MKMAQSQLIKKLKTETVEFSQLKLVFHKVMMRCAMVAHFISSFECTCRSYIPCVDLRPIKDKCQMRNRWRSKKKKSRTDIRFIFILSLSYILQLVPLRLFLDGESFILIHASACNVKWTEANFIYLYNEGISSFYWLRCSNRVRAYFFSFFAFNHISFWANEKTSG